MSQYKALKHTGQVLRMWLSGRALAPHAGGPGLNPQHHKNKTKENEQNKTKKPTDQNAIFYLK